MRRSPPLWYRALIGLWGLWFTVVLTAPAVLPPCPTHGGHIAHLVHDAAMPMPHMQRMQHVHRNATPASDRHQTSTACTCLGLCCCAGPVAMPTSQRDLVRQAIRQDVAVLRGEVTAPRISWAYAHPFATAPPTEA